MKTISIIFGSTTGNTASVAEKIASHIKDAIVKVIDVRSVDADDVNQADMVILGSSTWGYGEIQDDFLDFYNQMDTAFNNKPVAVFGCGDSISFGDVFCEAVNLIEAKALSLGATLVTDSLKIDGDVDLHDEAIGSFAAAVMSA